MSSSFSKFFYFLHLPIYPFADFFFFKPQCSIDLNKRNLPSECPGIDSVLFNCKISLNCSIFNNRSIAPSSNNFYTFARSLVSFALIKVFPQMCFSYNFRLISIRNLLTHPCHRRTFYNGSRL